MSTLLDMTFTGEIVSHNAKYIGRKSKVLSPKWREFSDHIKYQAMSIRENKEVRTDKNATYEILLNAVTRKDIDNIQKGILDALQGVIYANDSQVRILRTVISRPYDKKCKESVRIIVKEI